MLTGVFHLHEQEARQVMTPSPAVITVDISEDVETALKPASPRATPGSWSPKARTATACGGSCTPARSHAG